MNMNEISVRENAIAALSGMSIDEFADMVAEKVVSREKKDTAGHWVQKPYITAKEAAKMLSMSQRRFDELVEQGIIPEPVIGGGQKGKRIWRTEDLLNIGRI